MFLKWKNLFRNYISIDNSDSIEDNHYNTDSNSNYNNNSIDHEQSIHILSNPQDNNNNQINTVNTSFAYSSTPPIIIDNSLTISSPSPSPDSSSNSNNNSIRKRVGMNLSDLVTQVSEEDSDTNSKLIRPHYAHNNNNNNNLNNNSIHSKSNSSFWQRFFQCCFCRRKGSNVNTKPANIQPNKAKFYYNINGNSNSNSNTNSPIHNSTSNNNNNHSTIQLHKIHHTNNNNNNNNNNLSLNIQNTNTTNNNNINSTFHSSSSPLHTPNNSTHNKYLLPMSLFRSKRKCLILDLDETLVHSSFKPIPNPDFVLSIELDGIVHKVYVRKRPGCDEFLQSMHSLYEIIIFTASLNKYADPLLDELDSQNKYIDCRLFREHCSFHYGNYVKDLSLLNRRMQDIIIIDNSPFSYLFQPENAVAITSWFSDKTDRQLYDLIPILTELSSVDDTIAALAAKKLRFANGQVFSG